MKKSKPGYVTKTWGMGEIRAGTFVLPEQKLKMNTTAILKRFEFRREA